MNTRNEAGFCDPSYDVNGETNTVVLDELVVVLSWFLNKFLAQPIEGPTRIVPKSAMILGGTCAPHSLITLRKDAYVCMGMTPGMMGTVMPVCYQETGSIIRKRPLTSAPNSLGPLNEMVRVIKELCYNEFRPCIHFLFEDVDGVVFVGIIFWVSFRVSYKSDELVCPVLTLGRANYPRHLCRSEGSTPPKNVYI